MKQGLFITLEGLDGCGKSTQAHLLSDYLHALGYDVILTREPGGTPLAEEIRRLILTPSQEELDPMAEILLYTASRAQHVNHMIKPALAAGKIVICERFIDSSLAYQGYGLGRDLSLIREINRVAIGDFQPAVTFLLDMEPEQSGNRVTNRSNVTKTALDRIEARGLEFQERVREGFLMLAKREPRILLIKVKHRSIQEIQSQLVEVLLARLKKDAFSL